MDQASTLAAPVRSLGKPPSVAVIGCGAWGRNHVRNYAELGALGAIVDRHEDTVHQLVARHGGRSMAFEDVLADPEITACAFAMPPVLHHPLGLRALDAGKHVFLEKPMSLSVEEAESLCAAAEARGLTLMVGHLLQYHPVFAALRDLVRAGELGHLLHVSARRLAFGRIRRPEDALWELAPHDVSLVLALAGEEPTTVDALGRYHLDPTVADMATVQLAFPSGLQAQIEVSWLHPAKEHRLVVIGTDAMAVFDDGEPWERKLLVYPHRVDRTGPKPVAVPAEVAPVVVERGEPLREEVLHFLNCIREGRRPLTDGREGVRVLSVLERASAAMAARRGWAPLP